MIRQYNNFQVTEDHIKEIIDMLSDFEDNGIECGVYSKNIGYTTDRGIYHHKSKNHIFVGSIGIDLNINSRIYQKNKSLLNTLLLRLEDKFEVFQIHINDFNQGWRNSDKKDLLNQEENIYLFGILILVKI